MLNVYDATYTVGRGHNLKEALLLVLTCLFLLYVQLKQIRLSTKFFFYCIFVYKENMVNPVYVWQIYPTICLYYRYITIP